MFTFQTVLTWSRQMRLIVEHAWIKLKYYVADVNDHEKNLEGRATYLNCIYIIVT